MIISEKKDRILELFKSGLAYQITNENEFKHEF
jgi:hypothetical protein